MGLERSNPSSLTNPPGYSHVVKDGTTVDEVSLGDANFGQPGIVIRAEPHYLTQGIRLV